MVSYIAGCAAAFEYFETEVKITGIAAAMDTTDKWYFRAGKPDEIVYGAAYVSLNKNTGEVRPETPVDPETRKIIRQATFLEVPKEYLCK